MVHSLSCWACVRVSQRWQPVIRGHREGYLRVSVSDHHLDLIRLISTWYMVLRQCGHSGCQEGLIKALLSDVGLSTLQGVR